MSVFHRLEIDSVAPEIKIDGKLRSVVKRPICTINARSLVEIFIDVTIIINNCHCAKINLNDITLRGTLFHVSYRQF